MRKIAANYVFPIVGEPIKNGYVVFDDNNTVVEVGQLNGECADTEFYNGILCPGFTNAHCHIELSHLVNLFKQGTGMSGFINQINELRCAVDKEGRLKALKNQIDILYAQGVNAMCDISNCTESFAYKAITPLYTRTYVELFGTEPQDAQDVINSGKEVAAAAAQLGLDAAITPHSPYTMSPKLLQMASQEGLKSGFLSYHNQESAEEEDMISKGTGALAENYKGRGLSTPPVTGKPALVYFIDNLLKFASAPVEGRINLVHNAVINQKSIDYAKKNLKEPYFTICPLSNIFIHRALPPLELMRENNLKICLGTDSLSSNTILSIAKEIVCLHNNFPQIPLQEILSWACLNGAHVVGKEAELGSFEIGKRPGAVLISNINWDEFKLTDDSITKRIL